MGKKLKDPNKPKKPLTAYFRYLADIRESVKAENPGIKPAPLTKICGKKWSTLEVEKKKVYQGAAEKDNTVWKAKMEVYKKTPEFSEFEVKRKAHAAEQKKKDKKRKRKTPKDKNAPKKPATAFFLYSAFVREEVKQSMPEEQRNKVTIITKKIGGMWALISAEEKADWTAKSKAKREQYKIDFAEYQKTSEFANYQEILQTHRQKIRDDEMKEKMNVRKRVAAEKKRQKQIARVVRRPVVPSDDSDEEDQSKGQRMQVEETDDESSESESN